MANDAEGSRRTVRNRGLRRRLIRGSKRTQPVGEFAATGGAAGGADGTSSPGRGLHHVFGIDTPMERFVWAAVTVLITAVAITFFGSALLQPAAPQPRNPLLIVVSTPGAPRDVAPTIIQSINGAGELQVQVTLNTTPDLDELLAAPRDARQIVDGYEVDMLVIPERGNLAAGTGAAGAPGIQCQPQQVGTQRYPLSMTRFVAENDGDTPVIIIGRAGETTTTRAQKWSPYLPEGSLRNWAVNVEVGIRRFGQVGPDVSYLVSTQLKPSSSSVNRFTKVSAGNGLVCTIGAKAVVSLPGGAKVTEGRVEKADRKLLNFAEIDWIRSYSAHPLDLPGEARKFAKGAQDGDGQMWLRWSYLNDLSYEQTRTSVLDGFTYQNTAWVYDQRPLEPDPDNGCQVYSCNSPDVWVALQKTNYESQKVIKSFFLGSAFTAFTAAIGALIRSVWELSRTDRARRYRGILARWTEAHRGATRRAVAAALVVVGAAGGVLVARGAAPAPPPRPPLAGSADADRFPPEFREWARTTLPAAERLGIAGTLTARQFRLAAVAAQNRSGTPDTGTAPPTAIPVLEAGCREMDSAQAALAARLKSPSPGFNSEPLGAFRSDLDNFHALAVGDGGIDGGIGGGCTGGGLLVYTPSELRRWADLADSNTLGIDVLVDILRQYN